MSRMRKIAAAVAAGALLSTGAFAGIAPTSNVPVANAQVGPQVPANADLAIHKQVGGTSGTPADGTEQADVPGTPAPDVTFSVFPVLDSAGGAIDLTTNAGWETAADIDLNSFFTGAGPNSYVTLDPANTQLGAEQEIITDATGTATVNLDASLYLVVEHPNQTFGDQALAPSVPFLVTVPMTDPDTESAWLDTVHIYPKNQVVEASVKTITDPVPTADGYDATGAARDELIGYQIDATVPSVSTDTELNAFNVTDQVPAELGAVQDLVVTHGEATLAETTDYTQQVWTVGGQQYLHVTLTQARIDQLAAGDTVTVTFNAPVSQTTATTLNNQAWTSLSNQDWVGTTDPTEVPENPGTPSNETASIYGQINIQKSGAADAATLAGATFELYRCDADGVAAGSPIQVGGQTEWVTEADGTVSISGIHLANLNNTTTYTDLWAGNGTQFCLVETVALDGHSLLPEPVEVDMTYDSGTTTLVSVDQPIANVETNAGFTLPLTGGMGIWILLGAGAIVLVFAGGYYVIARKRAQNS